MALLRSGSLQIDYADAGSGELVVLVHSSISGNRQWQAMTDLLKDRYRVLAINLRGYGNTTPWNGGAPLSLDDEVELINAVCAKPHGPIHLVGHSFGALVAMKAALCMANRIHTLIAFEPNPFNLLEQHGRLEALNEIRSLLRLVLEAGACNDFSVAAPAFADYWQGDDTWQAMPQKRRQAFVTAMAPLVHEVGAVLSDNTTVAAWRSITARTLIVTSRNARRPIAEVAELLALNCKAWRFEQLAEGGHMAPLTHPGLAYDVVQRFLQDQRAA